MKVLIVIPARHGSSRFPGKPLALIRGVTLIERVYRQCARVRGAGTPLVATDHRAIFDAVESFGGKAVMTRTSHRSGTERVAEVALKRRADLIVNVQGDEPLLDPRAIETLILGMRKDRGADIGTLASPIRERSEYLDPNVVKVTSDLGGWALTFSRASIPFDRDRKRGVPSRALRHIGIYACRSRPLQKWVRFKASPLEKIEKLEQLRALENGLRIKVFTTRYRAIGVDVPADIKKVESALAKGA